jgi:NADPH-dependent 2,4-dienoyl-CoA reductase/sulfur reductase-like enzyme
MGRFFSQAHLLTVAAVAAGVAARGGQGNGHSSGHGAHGSGASGTTADYVIVGAGPAGVVLAEQLSRDGTKSVVLIEAGPDSINNATVDSESIATLLHREQDVLTAHSSCSIPFYH